MTYRTMIHSAIIDKKTVMMAMVTNCARFQLIAFWVSASGYSMTTFTTAIRSPSRYGSGSVNPPTAASSAGLPAA